MSQAASTTQLIALHGWAGDSRAWQPWAELAAARGWQFDAAERGYGNLPPEQPSWDPHAKKRVVIGHSMGPHLLPAELWQQATTAVCLASFAAFVPPGRQATPQRCFGISSGKRQRPSRLQPCRWGRWSTASQPAGANACWRIWSGLRTARGFRLATQKGPGP